MQTWYQCTYSVCKTSNQDVVFYHFMSNITFLHYIWFINGKFYIFWSKNMIIRVIRIQALYSILVIDFRMQYMNFKLWNVLQRPIKIIITRNNQLITYQVINFEVQNKSIFYHVNESFCNYLNHYPDIWNLSKTIAKILCVFFVVGYRIKSGLLVVEMY